MLSVRLVRLSPLAAPLLSPPLLSPLPLLITVRVSDKQRQRVSDKQSDKQRSPLTSGRFASHRSLMNALSKPCTVVVGIPPSLQGGLNPTLRSEL